MKVSVLMPIYNTREEFLRPAIESILNQTFTDFEFLIIDDASTLPLEHIVKSYNDSRIKYYKNDTNLGISKTRNKLLDLAQGEYLAIMDHDDISLPERFEKQVKILDKNPKIGVVGSWHGFTNRDKVFKRPVTNKEQKYGIFFECPLHHPATMIRKNVLTKYNIRYREDYFPAEDFKLWADLYDKTEFYNIPEVLFIYRNDYRNTTSNQEELLHNQVNKVFYDLKISFPEQYKIALIRKKLLKHLKIVAKPIQYILSFFALFKYLYIYLILEHKIKVRKCETK